MIIESIVTTLDEAGGANFAPMGITIGEGELLIRPYKDSATCQNIIATGAAVVNLTDSIRLFAESAISRPHFPTFPAELVTGIVLTDACSYYECSVMHTNTASERATFLCKILKKGILREFIGFSRAKNAIIEATILATRVRFLGVAHILQEYRRLTEIVQKTGGEQEAQAMRYLQDYVERQQ
ncbi:hypothetical protein CLG94_06680 [Candidatus Methylomirabilis limnetica]|uniref:Tetrahydromethanopterin synthesis protein n=1 Tax=Candidatus Methylomirabilis limnetica TaxID=2033718 RepID=A0A2T4TXZ4_9BACT|nr:DUF447 domain-containing protein [Candidatus Methylomirabilis limnetica]PTL35976.1 hypothetical protein CLG94_06680 [Candidatus Methylomirabilis limnetica]